MDKEKMNNDPQNTSEEITERIEEMIEEETETGAGTVSISDRLREAEADENDYDADIEDGYDEAEYDEADGEFDGENEYGEASEDAEYVEEDDDDEPRIVVNPKVVKVASLILFSGIILVFASIAWFTMNKDVGMSGMGVKTAPAPFELEVRGTDIENEGDFSKATDDYDDGVDLGTLDAYQTSGQHDKIIWRKTGTSTDDGHYFEGLSPNSHGKLTFWVVPNSTGALDIEFTFKVRGFIGTYTPAATDGADPTLNELFEVTESMEVTVENGLKDSADLARKKEALGYIQSHILFFSDFDGTNYSGFLGTGRSIRFGDCINPSAVTKAKYNAGNAVNVTVGQKYQVVIYWKWANTLEQMIFDSNSPYRDNPLFAASNTTDRNAVYTYLKDTTNNSVFSGVSNIESLLTTIQGGTDYNTALATLTNAYNNADQIIGNNLDYILIEMIAETTY